jgi:two-component system phosphate regulon response regulator PhoB
VKPLVLVNSRDVDFYLLINHILQVDGFAAALVGSKEEMLCIAAQKLPVAILLDCRPQSFSGVSTCAQLKQNPKTASISVVAFVSPGLENQYVDLLRAGVDESFVRPIAPAKLLNFLHERLASLNGASRANGSDESLYYGDIEMSLNTLRVYRNGTEIHLGPIEFRLLRHLLENPGHVFSRDQLINAAWPQNIFVEARTVDVHIGCLRRSLKRATGIDVIRTVRSAGYALNDQIA